LQPSISARRRRSGIAGHDALRQRAGAHL